jgi:O-antigen/teichoic acid export membrane protein
VVVALTIVPLVIHRLGLAAYGAVTLATSAAALLQVLDAGMVNAASRYFGVSAGANDRLATADQFVTISAVILAISGLVGIALFVLAHQVTDLFHLGRALRPGGVFATRVVAILIPVGMFEGVVASVLTSHGRFRTFTIASLVSRIAYAAAVVAFVKHDGGLQEMMRLTLLQLGALVLLMAPTAVRLMDLRHTRLLPWVTVREIAAYSTRIQFVTLTSVINVQADALIVGAVLPLRYVALYGVGATVASELRSVPFNAAAPIVVRLTQTLGRAGTDAAFDAYAQIQATWVTASTGFCAVALGASVFQIEAWLGHRFLPAGIVCVILLAGNLINLLTLPLGLYLQAIRRPEILVRYGMLGAGLNILLTVAFFWLGMYAIVAATATGIVVSSVALRRIAGGAVSQEIPSFLRPVPWLAAVAGASTAAASGALLRFLIPWHGAPGLIMVSSCMVPGAYAFVIALIGPARAWNVTTETASRKSLSPLIQALSTPAT